MQNKIFTFLETKRADADIKPTHLAYGNEFNGKFFLDPLSTKEFMKLYIDNNNEYQYHILEKQKDYGPILIDIDLEEVNPTNQRLYNNDNILYLVKQYFNTLNDLLKDKIDFNIVVLEKPCATIKNDGCVKDGFHLMIMDLCLSIDDRYKLRDSILAKLNNDGIFKGSVEKILDKAVVSSNGWFLYGCSKPNLKPYVVKHIYNNKMIDIFGESWTNKKLIKYLSIRKNEYSQENQNHFINNEPITVNIPIQIKEIKYVKSKFTIDFHRGLLEIFKHWADEYETWIKVAFACYNEETSDGDYFDLFYEWSQTDKYKLNISEIKKIWKNLKITNNNFTFKTLFYIAQNEYIEQFKQLMDIHFPIKTQNKTSNKDNSDYDVIKSSWEKSHFKVMNPVLYCQESNNKLIKRNKKTYLDAFENVFYNETKEEDGKPIIVKKPFIGKWMKDEVILTYDKFDFLPMQQVPPNIYNTFKGYKIESIKLIEDIDITTTKIFTHLFNLCGCDMNVFNYVNKWISRKLKNPNILSNTALIFKSVEGCGKDTFFNWLGDTIIGSDMYSNESELDVYLGKFNSILENKVLCVLNEVEGKSAFEKSGKIKDIITRPINTIEIKGLERFENTNNIGWVFLTNSNNPVSIKAEDRRFCGIECNNKIANNFEYFKDVRKDMQNSQISRAWFDYWMSLDTLDYDFTNNRPMTKFYKECQEANIPIIALWLDEFINEYNANKDHDNNLKTYSTTELFNSFNDYITTGKFNINMTIKKFSMDIQHYEGIDKYKNNTFRGYIINYNILTNYLKSKNYIC